MRKRVHAITLLVVLSTALYGQSGLERYGFGLQPSHGDVFSRGVGGITAVPPGEDQWLTALPASWQFARQTILHASGALNQVNIGQVGRYQRTGPDNFQLLLHTNNRTAYGLGLSPVTRVDLVFQDSVCTTLYAGDTLGYVQTQSIAGGLSSFYLGLSRKVGSSVALGIKLDILAGSIVQNDTVFFLTALGRRDVYESVVADRSLTFGGYGLELSLLALKLPGIKGQAGLQVYLPLTFAVDEARRNYGLYAATRVKYEQVGLPRTLKLGYAYDIVRGQRVMVEGSYSALPKSNKHDIIFGRHIQSRQALRIGWSKIPLTTDELVPQRYYYRMGFYLQRYYLSGSTGKSIADFGITGGGGIRSLRFGHRLSFALQVGRRRGDPLINESENYISLSVGVSAGERWFNRPKKRWE